MPARNSPPAAIRRQRPKWKGGRGSAIACSLAGVSHRARRARVTKSLRRKTDADCWFLTLSLVPVAAAVFGIGVEIGPFDLTLFRMSPTFKR